jgi:hypothetical protein
MLKYVLTPRRPADNRPAGTPQVQQRVEPAQRAQTKLWAFTVYHSRVSTSGSLLHQEIILVTSLVGPNRPSVI